LFIERRKEVFGDFKRALGKAVISWQILDSCVAA
jgi:hypothetical protein